MEYLIEDAENTTREFSLTPSLRSGEKEEDENWVEGHDIDNGAVPGSLAGLPVSEHEHDQGSRSAIQSRDQSAGSRASIPAKPGGSKESDPDDVPGLSVGELNDQISTLDPDKLPVFLRDHAAEIEQTSRELLPDGPERNEKVALQWVKTASIARVVHRSGILPRGVWPPSLARSFFYRFREHKFDLHDLRALHLDPDMIPEVGMVEKIEDLFEALGNLGEMAVYELRRAVDEAVALGPDLFEDETQEADGAVMWGEYWSPGWAAEAERERRKAKEARQAPGEPFVNGRYR